MTDISKKAFLTEEVLPLIKQIKTDTIAQFGLMTPQHMVEHLSYVTKWSVKNNGKPEGEPTKGQLGFKKFINNGAVMQHRPSDKTKEDLLDLKYGSLEEAIAQIPVAVERFYNHFKDDASLICYNPIMGELNFEELEIFHYQHYRYHLWQFGLLEQYPS